MDPPSLLTHNVRVNTPSPLSPCPQAIQQSSKDMLHVDGVVTFCEMAVPLVSRLAEALGLPGNTPAAVDAARDKVGGCGVFVWGGARAGWQQRELGLRFVG